RPTVDLILTLLCATESERFARRAAFASDGALVRHGLVHLISDPNYVDPPLLAQHVKPDEQIVRFLVGDGGLDSRLATAARLLQPRIGIADLPVAEEIKGELARFAQSIAATASGCLWLHGPEGVGKRGAAEAIAQAAKSVLLALDARLVGPTGLEPTLRLAL